MPDSQRICSAISCGPVAQFSPISGTSSALTTAAARGDVGAHQQCAGGLHCDLHEDRNVAAGLSARDLGAVHCGLDLQRVLAGLDQDRVDAAGDQAAALFGQCRLQRVVSNVAQSWQLGARADAADHPAMAAVTKLIRGFARQFGAASIDLKGSIRNVELGQRDG